MPHEEKRLCHPELFDELKINSAKDLEILRHLVYPEPAEGLLRMKHSQSFSADR
jgi:hypothetical protein